MTSNGTAPAVPDAVANANAQMTSADAAPDSARAMSEAMSAKASTMLLASADKPAEAQAAADDAAVVATDQLNDVDRALQQETPSTQTVAMASAKPAEDAPAQAADQRQLHAGQDLADRKDLHRLRRLADHGIRRTHVHGVKGGPRHWTQPSARPVPRRHLKPNPAAGTLPAKSASWGGSWRRSNTSLSTARARSASSR